MSSSPAARVPSHGSINRSTSACETAWAEATPGVSRSTRTAAWAWRARSTGLASITWTVIPPDSSSAAFRAVLASARPAAAAITVRATMIAMTQGIGPARRPCWTSRSSPPDSERQPRVSAPGRTEGSLRAMAQTLAMLGRGG
jgi:hypothetical protein